MQPRPLYSFAHRRPHMADTPACGRARKWRFTALPSPVKASKERAIPVNLPPSPHKKRSRGRRRRLSHGGGLQARKRFGRVRPRGNWQKRLAKPVRKEGQGRKTRQSGVAVTSEAPGGSATRLAILFGRMGRYPRIARVCEGRNRQDVKKSTAEHERAEALS